MFVANFILLHILISFLCVMGMNRRIPLPWLCGKNLPEESIFFCYSGACILKRDWCDGSSDCSDDSDEISCSDQFSACRDNQFKCLSSDMCIPDVGYCDGFISCPDGSDEKDCPCVAQQEENGIIEGQYWIGRHRSYHRCWKFVLEENEQLTVTVEGMLYPRECKYGNVTLFVNGSYFFLGENKIDDSVYRICPIDMNKKTFTFINDVQIRFISYFPFDVDGTDLFKITHDKSFVAFSKEFFAKSRKNATRWIRSQRDADWGWKENTARAMITLYLSNDLNFYASSHEDDLEAKQLELEVSTCLLRNRIEKSSIAEMATYINALQAICHNPRNFYGIDLVQQLKKEIEESPIDVTPFPYLTLCNAKEIVSEGVIDRLVQILDIQSDFGFALEIQALASMALSCISNNDQYAYLKQKLTDFLNKIKEEQKEDGSFGNEYTTALVIQALIANNQAYDKDWKFKAAADYLKNRQQFDGSFGDFLTTYLIMPALNGRSLVDLGRVNCTESQKRPREGNPVSDIKNRLDGKILVKYSLVIGDEIDQILPIFLRTPENITVFELMTLAADIDPKYKFKTHLMKEKMYVYEISSIPNDPEKNKFWFLYQKVGNDTVKTSKQSPDEMYVGDSYHIIMWYRTLIQLHIQERISVGDIRQSPTIPTDVGVSTDVGLYFLNDGDNY